MAEHPQMGCSTVWLHNGDTSLIHRHFPIRFPVGGRHCVRGRQTNMALPPKKHIIIPFRGGGGRMALEMGNHINVSPPFKELSYA